MTDKIAAVHNKEASGNETARALLIEALGSMGKKAWTDQTREEMSKHKNLLPDGSDSSRICNSIEKNLELPKVELKGFGVVIAPGKSKEEMRDAMKEHAKHRIEEQLPNPAICDPFRGTENMKKRDYSQGSEGKLAGGGTFVIPKENQITKEMIEMFKKATPVPMPWLEGGLENRVTADPDVPPGIAKKPKN